MESKRKMRLGLSMAGHGYHYSAWLHQHADLLGPSSFHYYLGLTRLAERGLFDMVFLPDLVYFSMVDMPAGALGRRGDSAGLEPLTLLAALAPQTSNIGLVATMSTTFSQPYHTARMFASIDLLSGGRAGWNVVTSTDDDEARNFGSTDILDKEARYQRAEEFADVVSGLWDTFDPDTFTADRNTGVYFKPSKVRVLNHKGLHFAVKGPLNVRRSPQGRPVIFQAGASEHGQRLAARSADVVYALQNDLTAAKAFYKGLKARLQPFGRAPDDIKIMPGLLPIVGETPADAQSKYKRLQEMVDPLVGLEYLCGYFGDLSAHPLDGPLPDLRSDIELASRSRVLLEMARREKLSIRQLFQRVSISNAHHIVVGTPYMIADVMEQWFLESAADGFNILPAVSPVSLDEFVTSVVPELQRRSLFRTSYEAHTLRENLGLPAVPPGTRLPSALTTSETTSAVQPAIVELKK